MSLHRTLLTVIISICAFVLSPTTQAQPVGFFGKSDDNSDFTGLYDPFCDLDTAWFEPINCDCPDERPLNSGWFFNYSRMRLHVSRPRNEQATLFYVPERGPGLPAPVIPSVYTGNEGSDLDGDWSWGNRFDFGWMSEEGTGLWIVARKQDSPDIQFNYDNIDLNDDDALRLDGEPWGPTFATVNGLRMWGIEANKVWRLAPTPKGTVIEPFLGPRYVRLRDHADRDDVFSNLYTQLQFPDIGTGTVIRTVDFNYRQSMIHTDNDLFGGQLGMRSHWRRGRWHISSDIRGLLFWNHQVKEIQSVNESQNRDFVATYNAAGQLTTVATLNATILQDASQNTTFTSSNNIVYGGELNLDASFEITQGFAVTLGGEVIAFGDGVGRGVTGNDDSLVMAGFSFGFTVNR